LNLPNQLKLTLGLYLNLAPPEFDVARQILSADRPLKLWYHVFTLNLLSQLNVAILPQHAAKVHGLLLSHI
jgi:hypothetical protein